MKEKKNRGIAWKVAFGISVCLNGILAYLILSSNFLNDQTKAMGLNLVTLLGNFFLSFLVSILYTCFCRSNDRENEIKRGKELENKIQTIYLEMLEMAPTYVYPATNHPIEDFNVRLNTSISNTRNFYYFSDRGLYLSKRLKEDIPSFNQRFTAVICLQDIREDDAFSARAEDYRKREVQQKRNRDIDTIIRDEKLSVLRSLYVISKLDNIDIKIYLHKEIPFIRFEITDELLAISFLPMLMEGKKYPPTLIYEKEQLFRQSFLDYLNDVWSRSICLKKEKITIDSLLQMGQDANIQNLTADEITEYYDQLNK